MAIPTTADIYADVQSIMGEPPGGEIYTSTLLLPFYGQAFRELYNLCLNWNLPVANRDAYYTLPAYTNVVQPGQLGVTDFAAPRHVWERGTLTTANISAVANTTPVQITTAAPHTFASNSEITIGGVSGVTGVNEMWFITVTGSTTFTLNGSIAGGSAASGGVAVYSPEAFVEMTPTDTLPQQPPGSLDQYLRYWKYENQMIYFTGSNQPRQLWIEYQTSGNPPSAGSLGIDNCRDFLAYRTAALAGASRDEDRTQTLNMQALGPKLTADGSGGFLRQCTNYLLKEKQKRGNRRQPFRPRRNNIVTGDWIGFA